MHVFRVFVWKYCFCQCMSYAASILLKQNIFLAPNLINEHYKLQIPVRPFRHNEYERFITTAFPYYGASFTSVLSLSLYLCVCICFFNNKSVVRLWYIECRWLDSLSSAYYTCITSKTVNWRKLDYHQDITVVLCGHFEQK